MTEPFLYSLRVSLDALRQVLAYADAVESDGYAEHWFDLGTSAEVDWGQVRRAIGILEKMYRGGEEE